MSEKTVAINWINQWKTTGPALREIFIKELQRPDYARKIDQLASLLNWACAHAPPKRFPV